MAYTTIKKPSDYFNTKLYTGNGGTQSITGVGFQPDFCWFKRRDAAFGHRLVDGVRGIYNELSTSSTGAEGTDTNGLTSFDSDGVSIGTGGSYNSSGGNYVLWNWLANGAGSANTDGTISSTVSANTTSGFSIVSYSGTGSAGATVGHSLGTTPSTIIVKVLNEGTYNWNVYHKSLGATKALKLNLTDAEQTSSIRWNDTEPTSSVFSLGNAGEVNETGKNYIAYCFADVQGFSKFGSYTGNGSTDGTFVYTGFKPAFTIVKRTDVANDWQINDNARNPSNEVRKILLANTSDAETEGATVNNFDYLSNGFKCVQDDPQINASGGTYIYMAFAEEPLVGDNPATAR
jgi:hypothetical protein